MLVKKFELDKSYGSPAFTLDTDTVSSGVFNQVPLGVELTKIHPSGWEITGVIQEDYYEWVNEFKARHNKYGYVEGDFETEVIASSHEALEHFMKHHPPVSWDYYDI